MTKLIVAWVVGFLASSVPAGSTTRDEVAPTAMHADLSRLPMSFERNVGQAGGNARFLAHGVAYAIALTDDGAVIALSGATAAPTTDVIALRVVGANRRAAPTAEQLLPGRVNYFIGNDRARWHTDVPTYAKVRYDAIYEGIDLVYYGSQGRLEYDFVVAPGANPQSIRLAFEGAEHLRVDARGNLVLEAHGHALAFERPVAYQLDGGRRTPVPASYRLHGDTIRFQIGTYDRSRALIVDPVLSYFSYLGGSGVDVIGTTGPQVGGTSGQAAAVDSEGQLVVAGSTFSLNFPTQGGVGAMPTKGGSPGSQPWVFVTKLSADAASLVYSTYIGGTINDSGYGLAVDTQGSAYVTGTTSSPDFPVTAGAYQTLCSPIVQSGQATRNGCSLNNPGSAFVLKLNPAGNGLVYSTFLGSAGAVGSAIAVDSAFRAYVAGASPNSGCQGGGTGGPNYICFPTTAGAILIDDRNGGYAANAAFITVLNPEGSGLLYSTMVADTNQNGTPEQDQGHSFASAQGTAVAVDATGNFYVAGTTNSGFLPTTAGSYQPEPAPTSEASGNNLQANRTFVFKWSPVGASPPALIYGTYLGATTAPNTNDFATGIAVDASGDAYMLGYTDENAFPTTSGAYQPTCGQSGGDFCGNAAFIAELSPSGSSLLHATYFGGLTGNGDGVTTAGAIALDAANNVYVSGTAASEIPQLDPVGTDNGGGGAIAPFVAKFDPTLGTLLFSTLIGTGGGGQVSSGGLALDGAGNIYLAGNVNSPPTSAATPGAFQSAYGGGSSDGFVVKIVPSAATITTTTTLTASSAAATVAGSVTFTATVTPASGTSAPTGTVTFSSAAGALGSAALAADGKATFATAALPVGTASVTAAYGGDAADRSSTSTAISVAVSPAAPTGLTAVASSGSVALTWTASAGAATYDVYQGMSAGGESTAPVQSSIAGTTVTLSGLANGTTYYFKVAAVGGGLKSTASNEASAMPTTLTSGGGSSDGGCSTGGGATGPGALLVLAVLLALSAARSRPRRGDGS